MPDKVWFATTNWNNGERPPEGYFSPQEKQAEWDAYNSSKFNGFPFPTIEKNQENQTFDQWDTVTYYTDPVTGRKLPSQFENRLVSVLGDHYSYKFTFDQLFKLFWRLKKIKINYYKSGRGIYEGVEYACDLGTATEFEHTSARENRFAVVKGSKFGTLNSFSKISENLPKEDESKLVTELNTNKWEIKTQIQAVTPTFPNPFSYCYVSSCAMHFDDNLSSDCLYNPPYIPGVENVPARHSGSYAIKTLQPDGEDCIFSIDFTQPVLKTGANEYRPFFYCNCCNPSPCRSDFTCEMLRRNSRSGSVMLPSEVHYQTNGTSDRPPHCGGVSSTRTAAAVACCTCCPYSPGNNCPCEPDPETGSCEPCLSECIDRAQNMFPTEPSQSYNRKFKKSWKGCTKIVTVVVKKNLNNEITKTYTTPCGGTTVSGKSLVDDILKPNVADSLYDVPGCYLFRIDFYGWRAIWPGEPGDCGNSARGDFNKSNKSWFGFGCAPMFVASDTGFMISKPIKNFARSDCYMGGW